MARFSWLGVGMKMVTFYLRYGLHSYRDDWICYGRTITSVVAVLAMNAIKKKIRNRWLQ